MSIKREGDIGGIGIIESRVENRQRDTFSRGQGFAITLTKVGPDEYKAISSDGKFEVTAPTEERAAYDLQCAMLAAGVRGEL